MKFNTSLLNLFKAVAFSFLLIFSGLSFSQDIKAKDITGKWYGQINFNDSEIIVASLTIQKKGKQLYGEIFMPELFNTIIGLDIELKKDSLLLSNQSFVQGYNIYHRGFQSLHYADDELKGNWEKEGTSIADISFLPQNRVADDQISFFEETAAKAHDKFKTVKHFDFVSEEESEEIIDEVEKRFGLLDEPYFSSKGTIKGPGVNQTMSFYYAAPNKRYFKTDYEDGTFFIISYKDNEKWVYDSQNQTTKIDKGIVDRGGVNDITIQLDDGGVVNSIFNSTINDKPVFTVDLTSKEGSSGWYYVDKENFRLIRTESNFEIVNYENFVELGSTYYPLIWDNKSIESELIYDFTNYSTEPFDLSIFDLPQEYRKKVIERDNKSADEYNNEGLALVEDKQYEEARVQFEKALEKDEKNSIYLNNLATTYQMQGDYYEAISILNKSIKYDENYGPAYNRLGVCKFKLNDFDGAVADFKRAVELEPNEEQFIVNLFTAQRKAGDEQSMATLDKVIEMGFDTTALRTKGKLLLEDEKYEEAIETFKKCIEKEEADALTYNYAGVAYYRIGEFEQALEYYKMAYEMDQTDYYFPKNIADTYFELDNLEEAREYYKKAIAFDNAKESSFQKYALVLVHFNEYAEANRMIDKALEFSPNSTDNLNIKGMALVYMNESVDAIEILSKSVAIDADQPEVFYYRGIANENSNNLYSACKDYQKATELGYEKAKEKVEELCQ